MDKSKYTLIILANSPGEISHWVASISKEFKKIKPNSKIHLYITPCQFASGSEYETATKIQELDRVFSPKKSMKEILCFFIRKPIKEGAVLFLGGDPFYGKCLSFKMGLPAYAYAEHKTFPSWGYKKVFYKHEIGDLMGDKIREFTSSKNEII